ncbi:DMT family transporter [Aestuariibaculum suncheonense]|uniref:EamA family transporter n=1 Tax=Aestuariibaculum suncheonense TaxID=1028745 RepID=A0A8J6Q782_9FLAO|nr:DMT family transporter [Aestuariibaculum suncheonense]MBD0835868.1 EamA family transporter [Aestuariibaculum suncheonense]
MNRSYLELHVAIILAGFTGLFGKLVTLNEMLLVFYRVLFSSAVLLILLKYLQRRKTSVPFWSKTNGLMLANGVLLALHWVFFFGSIKASTVSLGILCFCLTSFFTAILEPLINRKRFSIRNLGLSTLSLIGIALIFGFDSSYRLGIALGVISSIFISVFTIFNERFIHRHDTLKVTTFQMVGGFIGLGCIILLFTQFTDFVFQLPNTSDLGYLLILSLFCTVLLCLLLNNALRHISSFTVNLSFNLEPIYTIILSAIIFNEAADFTLSFWVGLSFIVLSILLQTLFARASRKRIKAQTLSELPT